MAKKNKDLQVLFTMLFPVYENEQGEEEVLFTKDINDSYESLGELLYVFPTMTDALLYFAELQEATDRMFKRAYYIQAFYTEVIALAVQSGTPSGIFCSYKAADEFNLAPVESIIFPDSYGIDITKLDTQKSGQRISNYLNQPIPYEEFAKKTLSGLEGDALVNEAYKRANEYLSHYVALMDDINLLSQYKSDFFQYFENGRSQRVYNLVEKFEYYMSTIEESVQYADDDMNIGDFILNLLTNPQMYKAHIEQEFVDNDPYYKTIAAHSTGVVIMKNKRLEEFDEDDLIDLAYMFKTNFPNEYIEMMVDFFARYALFNVMKCKESDFEKGV